MNRLRIRLLSLLVMVLGAVAISATTASDPPPSKLISGEVISLADYLINGHHGPEHATTGAFQVEKRALPVAILDAANDEVFIAVYRNTTSAAAKLVPLMGKMVNAQGHVYERHGVKVIEIEVVAEQ